VLDGHDWLRLVRGSKPIWPAQDVFASVQEFEPITRIAWGGTPRDSEASAAYHAWIITPTPGGCHLWTEETMQGPLWIELAKKAPDGFGRTHQKLLDDLAKLTTERGGSRIGAGLTSAPAPYAFSQSC
jgi:hypothetical protein